MLKTLKKFFDFCGKENRKLFIISIRLGVVSAICSAMRIPAAAVVIKALLDNNVTVSTLWTSLGIIVVSLIVTIAINMKSTMLQTKAGYRACADKRIEIAEHLRYLPMGWFNDNSLGEVTSVTTNTMENMANIATRVVMVTTKGFLTSGIIAVMMLFFDWRMGLITLAGLVLFFAVNAAMHGRSKHSANANSMLMNGSFLRCLSMFKVSLRSRISTLPTIPQRRYTPLWKNPARLPLLWRYRRFFICWHSLL